MASDFSPVNISRFDISAIFHRELDSRLYVDLIYRETQHFASFMPSSRIELGDYGHIDKRTGEFMRDGNVFRDFPELAELRNGEDLVDEAVTLRQEGHKKIWGSRAYGLEKEIDKNAEFLTIECEFKAGISYERDRHAGLMMIDAEAHELSPSALSLLRAAVHKDKRVRKSCLVTKVYRCSTYAMLLTNGNNGKAWCAFRVGNTRKEKPKVDDGKHGIEGVEAKFEERMEKVMKGIGGGVMGDVMKEATEQLQASKTAMPTFDVPSTMDPSEVDIKPGAPMESLEDNIDLMDIDEKVEATAQVQAKVEQVESTTTASTEESTAPHASTTTAATTTSINTSYRTKTTAKAANHPSSPIPSKPLVRVNVSSLWSHEVVSNSGTWTTGKYQPGQIGYTPLFGLSKMGSPSKKAKKAGFRGRKKAGEGDGEVYAPPLRMVERPWGDLDEDGEDLDEEEEESEGDHSDDE